MPRLDVGMALIGIRAGSLSCPVRPKRFVRLSPPLRSLVFLRSFIAKENKLYRDAANAENAGNEDHPAPLGFRKCRRRGTWPRFFVTVLR